MAFEDAIMQVSDKQSEKSGLDIETALLIMLASGMTEEEVLIVLETDLEQGGRIFGTYRNNIKNLTGNAVEWGGGKAMRVVFATAAITEFTWITAGGNVCPDCASRHGMKGTMLYFSQIGLPKSGFSVCKTNCQCVLVPSGYEGENLDKPLRRADRKKAIKNSV
jgi:hypothetical protein